MSVDYSLQEIKDHITHLIYQNGKIHPSQWEIPITSVISTLLGLAEAKTKSSKYAGDLAENLKKMYVDYHDRCEGIPPKKFSLNEWMYKTKPGDYDNKKIQYTCQFDFLEHFPLFFQQCKDNHDVLNMLVKHNIVGKGMESDCESSCSYFYFMDKISAEGFLKRLHEYLVAKHKRMNEAREW